MADVNRGDRPLSPHLQIYKPQWSWVPSILHRVTGAGLTLGALLLVWWLLAAATDDAYFALVDGLAASPIGILIWIGSTWALAYHALNGIRHLVWDAGYGFELDTMEKSAKAVTYGSVALTAAIWIAIAA